MSKKCELGGQIILSVSKMEKKTGISAEREITSK